MFGFMKKSKPQAAPATSPPTAADLDALRARLASHVEAAARARRLSVATLTGEFIQIVEEFEPPQSQLPIISWAQTEQALRRAGIGIPAADLQQLQAVLTSRSGGQVNTDDLLQFLDMEDDVVAVPSAARMAATPAASERGQRSEHGAVEVTVQRVAPSAGAAALQATSVSVRAALAPWTQRMQAVTGPGVAGAREIEFGSSNGRCMVLPFPTPLHLILSKPISLQLAVLEVSPAASAGGKALAQGEVPLNDVLAAALPPTGQQGAGAAGIASEANLAAVGQANRWVTLNNAADRSVFGRVSVQLRILAPDGMPLWPPAEPAAAAMTAPDSKPLTSLEAAAAQMRAGLRQAAAAAGGAAGLSAGVLAVFAQLAGSATPGKAWAVPVAALVKKLGKHPTCKTVPQAVRARAAGRAAPPVLMLTRVAAAPRAGAGGRERVHGSEQRWSNPAAGVYQLPVAQPQRNVCARCTGVCMAH